MSLKVTKNYLCHESTLGKSGRMLNILMLVIAIFLVTAQNAIAHDHDTEKDFAIKVSDLGQGLFELRNDRSGNIAVLVGDEGVLMVDTQMEHLVELIDDTQRELSDNRDVDLIINTHFHRDHVRGNAYFKARGSVVVAHNNVTQYMQNPVPLRVLGRDAPSFTKEYLPTVSLNGGALIKMNGQEVTLYHFPNAHTNSDLLVVFKEANVVHAGDLFVTGRFPFIDIDNGGSVAGTIAALEAIMGVSNQDTQIIAGHGPTATRNDVAASIQMLRETHLIVKRLVEKGLSLDAIITLDPLRDYSEQWQWEFIDAKRMVTIHYYDIAGKLN